MQRILKYELPHRTGPVSVKLPGGMHRVVHFGEQGVDLFIWAEVLDHLPPEPSKYYLAYTGDPVPDYGDHVGTVQAANGIVWHLYKIGGAG